MMVLNLKQTFFVAFTFAGVLFFGCKKAGTGGKAEVSVYVKHHESLIPGATVYVKFNEKEFPGSDLSKYNISQVTGLNGEAKGHLHIKHLKQGYYYFYSVGYDSTIKQEVSGGVPLHIKYKDRKENIVLEIPVTE